MTDLHLGRRHADATIDRHHVHAADVAAALRVSTARAPDTAEMVARKTAMCWLRQYGATLILADSLCAILATATGWLVRFGFPSHTDASTYILLSGTILLGWLLCLNLTGAYEVRSVSTGTSEAQRVLRAALNIAGSAAIVAYFSHILIARTFIAIVIPLGLVLQIIARLVVRHIVYRRRVKGRWTSAILAVGTSESVRHLIDTTRRNPYAGLVVIGACVEDAQTNSELAPGVPVLGDVGHAAAIAEQIGADVVAVAGSGLGPSRIRELGWELEGSGRQMVMAPGLTEVAGPRVHVSPVEGLPLMWVDQPQFTGAKRFAKRGMDLLGSSLLLMLGTPFLLLIGLLVRLNTPGPALYRSVRMGAGGKCIKVYKFRSMFVDADRLKAELAADNEIEGGVLFKMRSDPRVTPVGRILRKFSLDELPQLLNVFNGSMSLVGPRPPLPDEVEQYHSHVHRRLLVKPGMTGLWQVSGRSDLSWDEAVRLDLFYVENWSLALDFAIIARTVLAVARSRGAY